MKSNLGIYSGECLIGICGETTTLTDYKNEALHIGDIVVIKFYDKDFGSHSDYISVVCNNDFINYSGEVNKYRKDIPTEAFVMGIADASITKEGLAYENEEGELESGWLIEKLKGYEDCINGEHWKGYGIKYKDISNVKILPEKCVNDIEIGF